MSLPSVQPARAYDPSPLTEPVDPGRVREHHEQLKAETERSASELFVWIVIPFVAAIGLIPLGMLFTAVAHVPVGSLIVLGALGVLGAGITLILVRVRRRGLRDREVRYRLNRFADANGMTYRHRIPDPTFPGMIFGIGGDRFATDVLRTTTRPTVEYGHLQYLVSTGKTTTTKRWGYIAIELGTTLPHIVLDSVGNNSIVGSNLPTAFAAQQKLSLEGDFDRYFQLSCPEGYERDALYLFSPDIMARFVDHAALFDVEIVDNVLFLYTGPGISTTSPEMWAWLFDTVQALQSKVDSWTRWRDDRLLQPSAALASHPSAAMSSTALTSPAAPPPTRPPGVAVEGRRLRRAWNWAALWILLGAVAYGLVGYALQSL